MGSVAFAQREAAKYSALARKYRECTLRAMREGTPSKKGIYFGSYGNIRNMESGYYYGPRMLKAQKYNETLAREHYAIARQLLGIDI